MSKELPKIELSLEDKMAQLPENFEGKGLIWLEVRYISPLQRKIHDMEQTTFLNVRSRTEPIDSLQEKIWRKMGYKDSIYLPHDIQIIGTQQVDKNLVKEISSGDLWV